MAKTKEGQHQNKVASNIRMKGHYSRDDIALLIFPFANVIKTSSFCTRLKADSGQSTMSSEQSNMPAALTHKMIEKSPFI